MLITNSLFKKILSNHKILLNNLQSLPDLENNEKLYLLAKIDNDAKKLLLYSANFKCQYPGCNEKTKLTRHHLIRRSVKKFVGFRRYLGLRHYWANQIILCQYHHSIVDKIKPNLLKKSKTISDECVNKIKLEFKRDEIKCQKNG